MGLGGVGIGLMAGGVGHKGRVPIGGVVALSKRLCTGACNHKANLSLVLPL